MNRKVIIIIIAHKEVLTENEKRSLQQCYKVLGSYQTIIVCPEKMNVSTYKTTYPTADFMFIDPKWQANYRMFNKLKINDGFYKKFKGFKYVLFYELDAWVFRDELIAWCDKGYDYIGAPWFDLDYNGQQYLNDVGNGGFSLRNINSSLKLLRSLRYKQAMEKYKYLNWKGLTPRLPRLIRDLIKAKHVPSQLEKTFKNHEDGFWCRTAPAVLKEFTCNSKILSLIYDTIVKKTLRIPAAEEAIKFSFEVNPRLLFEMNNRVLPFGCHAWEKRDIEFWKPFMDAHKFNDKDREVNQ